MFMGYVPFWNSYSYILRHCRICNIRCFIKVF